MIELYISRKVNSHSQLKKRVESSNVALRIIEENSQIKATLREGSKTFVGVNAINNFLDELESFMWNWRLSKVDTYDAP